jgi:hypothetical protein
MLGDALGDAQHLGGFSVGHADEVTLFDQLRLHVVLGGEFIEGVIEGEQLVVVFLRDRIQFRQLHPLLSAAVAPGLFAPGAINEDAAHGLGGGGEEMRAILKLARPSPPNIFKYLV